MLTKNVGELKFCDLTFFSENSVHSPELTKPGKVDEYIDKLFRVNYYIQRAALFFIFISLKILSGVDGPFKSQCISDVFKFLFKELYRFFLRSS